MAFKRIPQAEIPYTLTPNELNDLFAAHSLFLAAGDESLPSEQKDETIRKGLDTHARTLNSISRRAQGLNPDDPSS